MIARARFALIALAAIAASPAAAAPFTIRVGESWAFAIEKGQPVRARKVTPASRPAAGEIKATLSAMAGTTMILTSNSATSYTFVAELVGAPLGKSAKRTCTLLPRRPTIEYWPVKAAAVRIGTFKAAPDDGGSCP